MSYEEPALPITELVNSGETKRVLISSSVLHDSFAQFFGKIVSITTKRHYE